MQLQMLVAHVQPAQAVQLVHHVPLLQQQLHQSHLQHQPLIQ
jgi:hypothetical protein